MTVMTGHPRLRFLDWDSLLIDSLAAHIIRTKVPARKREDMCRDMEDAYSDAESRNDEAFDFLWLEEGGLRMSCQIGVERDKDGNLHTPYIVGIVIMERKLIMENGTVVLMNQPAIIMERIAPGQKLGRYVDMPAMADRIIHGVINEPGKCTISLARQDNVTWTEADPFGMNAPKDVGMEKEVAP